MTKIAYLHYHCLQLLVLCRIHRFLLAVKSYLKLHSSGNKNFYSTKDLIQRFQRVMIKS